MSWTAPRVEEIVMSAEIGGYQDEFDREDPRDPGDERRASARARAAPRDATPRAPSEAK